MGMYKYLSKLWRKKTSEVKTIEKQRKIGWRKEATITRVNRPTRIDKARRLGYKAKQGIIVVRVKIRKGGRRKTRPKKGRKPSKMGVTKYTPKKSLQRIGEERVARKYPNLEVLNSYFVGEDGVSKWFEIILVDPSKSTIKKDKDLKWMVKHRRRAYRGLTSAGKKGRGLR